MMLEDRIKLLQAELARTADQYIATRKEIDRLMAGGRDRLESSSRNNKKDRPMKLYVLRRSADWDEAAGFVVRADSKKAARKIASSQCGNEGPEAWMDAKQVSCRELKQEGELEMILRDFLHG